MGRVNALGLHPNNDSIIFAGTPNGGLWRSYDYGKTWACNTDTLVTQQISSIVFDPKKPAIVYAGTGDRDATSRTEVGVLKSTDGGISWAIKNTGMGNVVVGKIIIDPQHPDTLLAATSSGIYKTIDGGDNWVNKGSGSGYKDLVAAPGDFNKLYATAGGSLYYSHNNGDVWTRSTGYLSGSRGAIAVSATSSKNATYYEWDIQPNNYRLINSTLNDETIQLVTLGSGYYSIELTVENFFNKDSLKKKNYLLTTYSKTASCKTTTISNTANGSGIFSLKANNQEFTSTGFDGVNSNQNNSCSQVLILNPDSIYSFIIETGKTKAEFATVYIDYNDNGSFNDPGEQVYSGPSAVQFHSFMYQAPKNPLLNQKLLVRVVSDQQAINNSCGQLAMVVILLNLK